jgi:hypothetical protein
MMEVNFQIRIAICIIYIIFLDYPASYTHKAKSVCDTESNCIKAIAIAVAVLGIYKVNDSFKSGSISKGRINGRFDSSISIDSRVIVRESLIESSVR